MIPGLSGHVVHACVLTRVSFPSFERPRWQHWLCGIRSHRNQPPKGCEAPPCMRWRGLAGLTSPAFRSLGALICETSHDPESLAGNSGLPSLPASWSFLRFAESSGFPVLPSSRSFLRVGPRSRWRRAISSASREGAQGLSRTDFSLFSPSPGCPQNPPTSPPASRRCPPAHPLFCPQPPPPASTWWTPEEGARVALAAVTAAVGVRRRHGRTARVRPHCGSPGRCPRFVRGRPAWAHR